MRSTKSIMLIVIALGCGLIASIGISQVMDGQKSKDTGGDTEMIYVAASNVAQWSKLNSAHVRQEEWPIDKVPPGTARSIEEFEGLSPKYPLYPGEPIVISKLSDSNGKVASERIPEGFQVFAVKVDKESSLAGLVKPGDKVDILVFMRGRAGIETGARTILRNATIFAVNDQFARADGEGSIDAKTISLLVEPDQSERLLLAKQLGTIHLALRKPGDESNMDTDGAKPGDLDNSHDSEDGMLTNSKEKKPTNGLFGLLSNMGDRDSMAVDTSNAAVSNTQMVIMSPTGVLNTFTFPENLGRGPLAPLPPEIGQASASNSSAGLEDETLSSDEGSSTEEVTDTSAEEDVEESADGFLDPSALGL